MPWPSPLPRRDEPELMDAPGLPEAEVADAYRVLRRVNRQFFGGGPSLRRELRRALAEDGPFAGPLAVADLGSGSGDLLALIRDTMTARGLAVRPLAIDLDPIALRLARDGGLLAGRADALRLPLADRSVDLVLAVKFAHHFSGPALRRLLAEMARVARRRVVILDIRRCRAAYWGFRAWSLLFTRNRLVRHDGPLSVLRAFTRSELEALALDVPGFDWQVRPHPGFQLALVGRRRG